MEMEERTRESREATTTAATTTKRHWANLSEDVTKLKKLRVPELNKQVFKKPWAEAASEEQPGMKK